MRRCLLVAPAIAFFALGPAGRALAGNPPGPPGPPGQSCQALEPNTPGNSANSPGSPFNEPGSTAPMGASAASTTRRILSTTLPASRQRSISHKTHGEDPHNRLARAAGTAGHAEHSWARRGAGVARFDAVGAGPPAAGLARAQMLMPGVAADVTGQWGAPPGRRRQVGLARVTVSHGPMGPSWRGLGQLGLDGDGVCVPADAAGELGPPQRGRDADCVSQGSGRLCALG